MTDNDFAGGVNLRWEAKERINKGVGIEFEGVIAIRVENRVHFKVGVGERIDGNFEGAFEGGTIGADVKLDGFDGRHELVYQS